jgi:hypothetical protein
MGNRAHNELLKKYPFLRRHARGFHADGPPPWMKRLWAHKWRARMRQLLLKDPDSVSYPRRCGDRWSWY